MKVTIYGASDDLCEVDGDISEEFCDSGSGKPFWLAFEEGSIIGVQYDLRRDGTWRVWREREGAGVFVLEYVADAGSEARGEGYSDRATLEGALGSVRLLKSLPRADAPAVASDTTREGL